MCLATVKQYGKVLQFVQNQTEKMCLALNKMVMQFIMLK